MASVRAQHFPKASLWLDGIKGLNLAVADALKNWFLTRPLTEEELEDLLRVPAPLK